MFLDNDERKLKLDKMLVDLIVLDLQPFSIVEDKGFRALINYLDPKYVIPCRKTMKKFVDDEYVTKRRIIQAEVDAASAVCITTDTWTSVNLDNIISVTCHYINKDFELKTRTLQTEKITGSHTAHALSQTLNNIFCHWNINEKVKCAVTDNAANMLAAVRNLNSVSSVSCFAHTLNLVVKKSLAAINDLVTIRKKCRSIVCYFKSSCLAKDKLQEMQNEFNIPQHKLILETDTRWNSTYNMFHRLVEQRQAIESALEYFHISFESLTDNEWDTLANMLPILQPFFSITMEFSTESKVSISKVIVAIKQLHKCLELNRENILAIKLKEMTCHYFNHIETNSAHAMATILDPRFKVVGFRFTENAEKAKKLIIDEISNINVAVTAGTSSDTNNVTPNPNNTSVLWSSFDNEVIERNLISAQNCGPTNELENYIAECYATRTSDPLQYWQKNTSTYPNLAKLAKSILCCPATSVPCERIFSTAGEIISLKRNRLKDTRLNQILLLKKQ